MPFITGFPSSFSWINGRVPDNAQPGSALWGSTGGGWRMLEYGVAENPQGLIGDALYFNPGIADADITLNFRVSTYNGWTSFSFNANPADIGNATTRWTVSFSAYGWIALQDGSGTYAYHRGVDGLPWDGNNPLVGAGDHKLRIRAIGDVVQVWFDDLLIHDVTVANRPYKTQTAIAFRPWDDAGELPANRGKVYDIDVLRSI